MSEVPPFKEFYAYFSERLRKHGDDPRNYTEWLESKYEAWKLNGWKKEKGNRSIPIKIWKTTLLQCIPHRIANKVQKVVTDPSTKKRSKMDEIEINDMLFAYSQFKEKNVVLPPNEKCFDYLLKKGVFKNGKVISKKTGKPWQDWYSSLTPKAIQLAYAFGLDQKFTEVELNKIKQYKHPYCEAFVKLQALQSYFKRFSDRNQLKSALLALN